MVPDGVRVLMTYFPMDHYPMQPALRRMVHSHRVRRGLPVDETVAA